MKKLTRKEMDHNTGLLFVATKNNDVDEVKRLIPISDPKMEDSSALLRAVDNVDMTMLELLIPIYDPHRKNRSVLQYAAEKGHTECVNLLIPVSDPKTNNSGALLISVINEHIECIKCLIPVSDYQQVLTTLTQQSTMQNLHVLQRFVDEYEVLMQKERLTEEIKSLQEPKQDNTHKRKM